MNNSGSSFFVLCLLLAIAACNIPDNQNAENESSGPGLHPVDTTMVNRPSSEFEIRTYKNENEVDGWGYDVYRNGKLLITQPHIPGVNGIQGFKSVKEAYRTAEFVVYKVLNNLMPPSLALQELDSLGIRYLP